MILEKHRWKPNELRGDAAVQYIATLFDVPDAPPAPGMRGRNWELYVPCAVYGEILMGTLTVRTVVWSARADAWTPSGGFVLGDLFSLEINATTGSFEFDPRLPLDDYVVLGRMVETFMERFTAARHSGAL